MKIEHGRAIGSWGFGFFTSKGFKTFYIRVPGYWWRITR